MKDTTIKKMINRYETSKISEQTKVREVLQQATLLGLERRGFFEKAAFYGGTSLRILYGLDRFSEDLDFTLLKPTPDFDFNFYLDGLQKELAAFGFEMEVAQKLKANDSTISSAFMKMNTIKLYLVIGDEKKAKTVPHNEKIQIKLEVDIDPPIGFRVENQLVLNPSPFYVLSLIKSDLFAGKMHALLCRTWKIRVKGRDWYDLIWYIQNNVPMGLTYLEACLKQSGHLKNEETLTRDMLMQRLHEKIDQIDWENAKEDIRPFIAEPDKLNIWSCYFFKSLLNKLIIE